MYKYTYKIMKESDAKAAASLGVYNLEASYPLEEYTAEELEDLRNSLIDSGMRIALLETSLEASDHENIRKLFLAAHLLNTESIKFTPKADDDMGYVFAVSKAMSIPVMLENRSNTHLSDQASLTKAISESQNTGLIWNPAEFVREKAHPFLHAYTQSHSKNRIKFLRINDALYTGEPVKPGQGSAEIKELASILLSRSFDGYFMLSPNLSQSSTESELKEQLDYIKFVLKQM